METQKIPDKVMLKKINVLEVLPYLITSYTAEP